MQVEQHLAAIREAVDAFATSATTAGLEAPVPTTPDWDVRRLVAHQGLEFLFDDFSAGAADDVAQAEDAQRHGQEYIRAR